RLGERAGGVRAKTRHFSSGARGGRPASARRSMIAAMESRPRRIALVVIALLLAAAGAWWWWWLASQARQPPEGLQPVVAAADAAPPAPRPAPAHKADAPFPPAEMARMEAAMKRCEADLMAV